MDSKSLSHTRWKCQYHIVFIPKYRKKQLYGRLREDVRSIIKSLCAYKNVEIVEGAVCSDHVHFEVVVADSYHLVLGGFSKKKQKEILESGGAKNSI